MTKPIYPSHHLAPVSRAKSPPPPTSSFQVPSLTSLSKQSNAVPYITSLLLIPSSRSFMHNQCPPHPFPSSIQQESAEVSFKRERVDPTVNVTQLRNRTLNWQGSEQIPGDKYPWRRVIVQRRLTSVDPQYGPCFISPFWHLQFCDGSWIFKNLYAPLHQCPTWEVTQI